MRARLEIVSRGADPATSCRELLVGARAVGGARAARGDRAGRRVPPRAAGARLEQDPVHRHKDVLRAYATRWSSGARRADLTLRLAALLHDIGKPKTREITPQGVTFHHHEVVGARMAEARLRELRYPNGGGRRRAHARRAAPALPRVRRGVERLGRAALRARCRASARPAEPAHARRRAPRANQKRRSSSRALQDDLEERIARLAEQENLDALRPPLDGNEIMEHLGLPPGPLVGEARELPHGAPAGAGADRARGGAAAARRVGGLQGPVVGVAVPTDRVDPGER